MTPTFKTSKPCHWVEPRPHQDASARYRTHGPIVGMAYPREPFWRRLNPWRQG